jgi:hypothetical protein
MLRRLLDAVRRSSLEQAAREYSFVISIEMTLSLALARASSYVNAARLWTARIVGAGRSGNPATGEQARRIRAGTNLARSWLHGDSETTLKP